MKYHGPIWFAVSLLLAAVPTVASAETIITNVGTGAEVYTYVTDNGATTRVVCMWAKKGSDIDILMNGDTPDGLSIGVGLSSTQQLETIEIGAPGTGAITFFALFKVSGPKTKTYCNVSTAGSESVSSARGSSRRRVQYLGNLEELALEDPRFAALQEDIERAKRFKRGVR